VRPVARHIDESALVKSVGFPATLIHGDTAMLDRWLWLQKHLPRTNNEDRLLDVGCGSGAYVIGAALRGYEALGLDWSERNVRVAQDRARICNAHGAHFEAMDARRLDTRPDFRKAFDIVVCLETIEHILDDRKLMADISACLKPGGRVLLSTPQLYYRAITPGDNGPWLPVETGDHVRRGYTPAMLKELCDLVGLVPEEITYITGFLSQKITFALRKLSQANRVFGWAATLPLRLAPPTFDRVVTPLFDWPHYSICLEAYKPRYAG
jgi:SAM-dependent methyltransferase